MTAGQDALREAARLEAARFYGNVTSPDFNEPFSVFAARAEAELEAALDRRCGDKTLNDLLAAGATVSQLVNDHGFTYGQVRAARKQAMKGVA